VEWHSYGTKEIGLGTASTPDEGGKIPWCIR
jgi:hypothetical protein